MSDSSILQGPNLNINQVYKMGFDAFMNSAARTGYGQANLMNATQYPMTRLTQDYSLLNSLYRNNWLARNVIRAIPQDAMKNGWKYEVDLDPKLIDKIKKMESITRLRPQLQHGLNMGRLYGGAVGLIRLDGQEDILDRPLELDSIMPGDYKGLDIADRWSGVYPGDKLVTEIGNLDYGLPEFYEFRPPESMSGLKVHHTRIVRFLGHDLPEWEKQVEQYWGASIIEDIYEELRKRDNTSANIAGLVFLSNLRVYKMSDFGELQAGGNENNKRDLFNLLEAMNRLMNNNSMSIISKDDDFQTFSANFSGLNEIYESFMLDMSGACQIPATKLFGRAPAGMNATGESDMRNYYDVIEGWQESHMRPALEKLMPIFCMSTLGQLPDDIELGFNPIYTPSEKESAELVKGRVEALVSLYNTGEFSPRFLLSEAAAFKPYGFCASITDADIAAASETPTGPLVDDNPLDPGEPDIGEPDAE